MKLKLFKPIILVFFLSELFISSCDKKKTSIQIPNSIETDSLNQEIFILKTSLERYEIALEMLRESNPEAAKLYDSLLHTKTE